VNTLLAGLVTVLLLGDSHVEGVGSGEEPGFAEVAAAELVGSHEVRASGCGGSSLLDWHGKARSLCYGRGAYQELARPGLPAEVVVLLAGTNDAVGYLEKVPTPAERYGVALAELVDRLLRDGAGRIVLMTPPPLPRARTVQNERLAAYAGQIRALAAARPQVDLGPDLLLSLDRDEHFNASKIHMKPAGHRFVGKALAAYLKTLPPPEEAEGEKPAP